MEVQGGQETPAIIEAEIVGVILRFGQGDINVGQDPLEGGQMQWFGVGNHAVEVKNNRA